MVHPLRPLKLYPSFGAEFPQLSDVVIFLSENHGHTNMFEHYFQRILVGQDVQHELPDRVQRRE